MGIVTTSCDSTFVGVEEIVCHFGEMSVETTPKSATITTPKPYLTVDGKPVDAKISLHYIGAGHDIVEYVEEYREEDGEIIFEIDRLTPETQYKAHISLNGGEYGIHHSKEIHFTTDALHVAEISMRLEAEVAAKGLMATLSLRDIAYMVDGNEEDIDILRVEYTPANMEAWAMQEYAPHKIVDGTLSVELPFANKDYLTECSNYDVRLTLYPANSDYAPITANIERFTTTTAEVSATIPKPRLTIDAKSIVAYVEGLEIFYDGVSEHYYTSPYATKYQFRYRMAGTEEWSLVEVGAKHGKMEATLVLWDYADDTTYEVQAMVIAGAEGETLYSDVATIKTPAAPTPPPVVGDGDTAAIAGTWHLTTWRDAVPSFDIYLDITANGVVTLYQRLESRAWECFYSSAAMEYGIIKGTYSDGVAWGATYYVNVDVEGNTMTWEDTADSSDISVYTRSELPEDITTTRGAEATGEERFL